MAKIEKEQAEARKAKLPAFWLCVPTNNGRADIGSTLTDLVSLTCLHAPPHQAESGAGGWRGTPQGG